MLVSPEMRDGAGGIRSSRASSSTASKPDFENKNKTNKELKTYQREQKKTQPHGPRGRSAQDYTYFCWAQWCGPAIPTLGRSRQEDCHSLRSAWLTRQVPGQL